MHARLWRSRNAGSVGGRRSRGVRVDTDFDLAIDDAHLMAGQRLARRRAEHAAITDIERSAMQRADQARATQAALIHPRERVRTDIVECMQSFAAAADDDFATADRAAMHLALGERVGRQHGLIR